MNEDSIREFIKASTIHTSDKFTQDLMSKIERQNALKSKFNIAFLVGCSCCVIILVLIAVIPIKINYLNIVLPALLIKLIGVIFVFSLLNRLIVIKERLTMYS